MKHEEAEPLLSDHLEGRLPDPLRAAVDGHAAVCPDCQALIESYRTLDEGFRAEQAGVEGERPPGDHPPVEVLVDFALMTAERPGARRADLAAHLEACATCAREVETVRSGQGEAEGGRRFPSVPHGRPAGAALRVPVPSLLAAAAVLLVMAYPAFLGLRELPRIRGELKSLVADREARESRVADLERSLERNEEERRRLANWTGAIAVPLLAAPLRAGTEEETTITVAEGQPFIILAVDPDPTGREAAGERYVAEVLRPDRTAAWSLELDPGEVRRQMARTGSLAFLLPSKMLPPGSYLLRMARRRPGGERPILEVPFSIAREE